MLQNRGLVELKQADAGRPGKPVGARIQTGSHQHDLADSLLLRNAQEKPVKKTGAHNDRDGVGAALLQPMQAFLTRQHGGPRVVEQAVRA